MPLGGHRDHLDGRPFAPDEDQSAEIDQFRRSYHLRIGQTRAQQGPYLGKSQDVAHQVRSTGGSGLHRLQQFFPGEHLGLENTPDLTEFHLWHLHRRYRQSRPEATASRRPWQSAASAFPLSQKAV